MSKMRRQRYVNAMQRLKKITNKKKKLKPKLKAENCKAAKANHGTYTQGGRVYKTNEKGEREYMDDKDLEEGKEKAQQRIDENCN